MRLLHHKEGGATDGAQNIMLTTSMEEKLTPIKIMIWTSWTVSGCLDTRVGVKYVHLVTYTPIRDIVLCKWKITVVHWVLFPVGGNYESCDIALDVMLP